jgi:hypothetical protein
MKYYYLLLFYILVIFIKCFVLIINHVEEKHQAEKQYRQSSHIEPTSCVSNQHLMSYEVLRSKRIAT